MGSAIGQERADRLPTMQEPVLEQGEKEAEDVMPLYYGCGKHLAEPGTARTVPDCPVCAEEAYSRAAKCHCGEKDCWDPGDYSWLASQSGWYGELHGTDAAVFFIHGKKIREQRSIKAGDYPVEDLPRLIAQWSTGLPNAYLSWSHDTGGGDCGLWIEGIREPNADDWVRLKEVQEREDKENRRKLEELKRRYESGNPQPPPVDVGGIRRGGI